MSQPGRTMSVAAGCGYQTFLNRPSSGVLRQSSLSPASRSEVVRPSTRAEQSAGSVRSAQALFGRPFANCAAPSASSSTPLCGCWLPVLSQTSGTRSRVASSLGVQGNIVSVSGFYMGARASMHFLAGITGDRVCLEGNNRKQADFLARALVHVDPQRVHGLHVVQSSTRRVCGGSSSDQRRL